MVLQKVAVEVFMYFLIKAYNIPTLILKKISGYLSEKNQVVLFLMVEDILKFVCRDDLKVSGSLKL